MPNQFKERRRASLKRRLPLVLLVTIALALGAFVALSYWQIRQALLTAGGERAEAAATQLAGLLTQSNQPRIAQLSAAAADPAILAFLTDPSPGNRDAAERRLRALRIGQQEVTLELWRSSGERALMATFAEAAEKQVPDRPFDQVTGTGPLRLAGDRVYSEATVPVRGQGAGPAGYLRFRSFMARNQATADLLNRLVGSGASILIGSPATGVWTNLAIHVAAPALKATANGVTSYVAADGSRRVGALVTMTGAPWVVLVDYSQASVLAPLGPVVWQMLGFGLVLMLVATLVTRQMMARITTPLGIVTDAAERIAAGTYSTPVVVTRRDEVGRLAQAFNDMAARIKAGHDALERQNAQLRESEARKSAVLNGALDAIVRMDERGAITEFNPAAEATFGYTRDEAVGRDLADLIIPVAYRARHRDGLARYLATGDGPILNQRLELVAQRKDGTEFPAEVSIIAIRTDGPPMFSSFVRDLTDQKSAERTRLRSIQLEEENLRVQEASRLKSEFLANMSHELRTPLNAIIGFAELLHDGVVSPDQPQHREFLRDILASGQHLLRLINDVLDLSKVEAGRLEFHPESLDLHEAVTEALGLLRTTAASKQLRLVTELDPDVREVSIDRGRFKQVLYNYVSNAVKFTPEGGRVTVRTSAAGPDRFRIEVVDTGVGIAPGDIASLFIEFNQLNGGAAKSQQGTGLGLALTRRLVEAQGGEVGVHSTPGEGSTFFAELPRYARSGTPPARPRSFPAARIGAPSVLVIEDSERDQDLLVKTLVGAGYAVETATTGAHALAKLDAQAFDAITLDLLLPDMTGADILEHLRGSSHRDVPVVVITVVAENAVVSAFTVADILTKPLDGDALIATLARLGLSAASSGRVMVVDDDAGSLRLMAASLQQLGVESSGFADAGAALADCATVAPLAVVLDLQMPGMDGFEFVERFRQMPHCRRVPVIVWTVKDLTREDYARLQQSVQTIVGKGQSGGAPVVAELQQFLAPERLS